MGHPRTSGEDARWRPGPGLAGGGSDRGRKPTPPRTTPGGGAVQAPDSPLILENEDGEDLDDAAQSQSPEGEGAQEDVDTEVSRILKWLETKRDDGDDVLLSKHGGERNEFVIVATRLRIANDFCVLDAGDYEAIRNLLVDVQGLNPVEEATKWWETKHCCACDVCEAELERNSYPRTEKSFEYMYVEFLARSNPWFDGKDERDALIIEALEESNEAGYFRELATKFSWLDEVNLVSEGDSRYLRALGKIPINSVEIKVPQACWENAGGAVDLKKDVYRFMAAVNSGRHDCIFNEYGGEAHAPNETAKKVGEIIRGLDGWNNRDRGFWGTRTSNYCIGSRGMKGSPPGLKYYVGLTDDRVKRHRQHLGLDRYNGGEYSGSAYIGTLCNKLGRRQPDNFGGWKVMETQHRAKHVRGPSRFTCDDETSQVERLAKEYGPHHVRGGIHARVRMYPSSIEVMLRKWMEHYGMGRNKDLLAELERRKHDETLVSFIESSSKSPRKCLARFV